MDHGGVDSNRTTVVILIWDHGDPDGGYLMPRSDAQFKLRLPEPHRAWVERKAKEGFHSMQAVLLKLVDEAMKCDEQIRQA
jgi:hypothetical protein